MLAKPHLFFKAAQEQKFSMGAFNASNLEMTQAIIAAASAQNAPVIVQTSEGAIEYAGLTVLTALIKTAAEAANIPVILHLDHGKSLDIAKQCIEAGYTSVMIDVSSKPFEENMEITKSVVEYAHDRGVWVEGELGAILGKEGALQLQGSFTPDAMLTDPKQAAEFVKETGIDALAVSVGTIHGAFTGQEYIRFELLEEIQHTVPHTPLVIHGASGISDGHLKQAVSMNVCKVNVDTDLRIAFYAAVREQMKLESKTSVDPRVLLGAARQAMQNVVEKKISIFGSSDKARLH